MNIILYLEVNIVCIAILFSVFIRDKTLRNNDTYHILFTRVLFSNILFFVADILWGLMSLTETPHIISNWVVNIIYFSISGVSAYFWLVFAEKMLDRKSPRNPLIILLRMLPATLLLVLSLASVKTHWLFYIDSVGRYQRGSLYILQPILAYILPVYATLRAIVVMKKNRNVEKRRQYRSIALFYLLPALGGIFQVVVEGTPMLNIGIALSGLWVYFTFQDNMIMLDPLTALNNRRSFDKKLDSMVHSHDWEEGKHLWLIIMDVDYFKKINDGFGHAEGDRALVTIAETLKEVSGGFNCLAARIGGDEFAVCCESEKQNYSEKVRDEIKKNLAQKTAEYPFRINLSIGCAEFEAGMSAQQLYVTADKLLYDEKKKR